MRISSFPAGIFFTHHTSHRLSTCYLRRGAINIDIMQGKLPTCLPTSYLSTYLLSKVYSDLHRLPLPEVNYHSTPAFGHPMTAVIKCSTNILRPAQSQPSLTLVAPIHTDDGPFTTTLCTQEERPMGHLETVPVFFWCLSGAAHLPSAYLTFTRLEQNGSGVQTIRSAPLQAAGPSKKVTKQGQPKNIWP